MSILQKIPNSHRKLLSVYVTFLIFFVVNLIMDPTLLTSYDRLWPLSLQFVPLMLCAMSQGCIMLTGGINLAIGTSLSLMTAVAATTMRDGGLGIAGGILATLAVGVVTSAIMGIVTVYGRLPDIIVTLAFSYIWKGVALRVLPAPGGYIPDPYKLFLNSSKGFPVPAALLIVGICLVVWKLIKNTRHGVNIYAVGGSSKASYENGINVKRTRVFAYALSGLFLAAAGLVLVGQTGSGDPGIGVSYQMNSIAAAILGGFSFLGGVGQMKGAVMGAFIFTSLVNILFFSGLSPFYQYIVQGMILIVAIGIKAVNYYRNGGDR